MSSEKCLRHPTVRARSCKECARIASSTMDIHRRQLHCQEGSASVVIKVTANVMRMILHAPGEVDGGHPELSPKNAHIQPMEYGFAPVESGQAVSFVVDLQHLIAGFNTVASKLEQDGSFLLYRIQPRPLLGRPSSLIVNLFGSISRVNFQNVKLHLFPPLSV